MAASAELSQDAVLKFLAERGGRARNADLLEHFRGYLNSPEPQRRAQAREGFKALVNAVATVRQEPGPGGAKYVQLRKKYRGAVGSNGRAGRRAEEAAAGASVTAEAAVEEAPCLPPEEAQGGGGGGAAPEAKAVAERRLAEGDPSGTVVEAGASASPPSKEPPPQLLPPAASEVVLQPGLAEGNFHASEGDDAAEADGEPVAATEEDSPPSANTPALSLPSGGVLTTAANTPRCGRKNLRERMLGSSPQMKRGGWLSRGGSSRSGGGGGGDSDSASLASSSAEDEGNGGGGSVALDPLEHAWMLCASEGRWESLEGLLSCEPALLAKRDFITGFSCLHWAAKHGRPEVLALLLGFAHRHRLPVDVNARTSGGYTALHLAALHGHLEVVKLLVGAYDADVELRDYSGRKASHYLGPGTAEEVRQLVGALRDEADGGAPNGGGRWRLSRVLPAHLITYKLSHLHHGGGEEIEAGEGAGGLVKSRELIRKASGSGRMKPRLNKIRFRTQIIHTTPSFRGDVEEKGQEERTLKGSFKLRPKSNVFG